MELVARLEAYVASRLPQAQRVTVTKLDRIFGGGSRETYRFVVDYREDGRDVSRPLILRRDPPASLIQTERRIEFAAYKAFHGTRVPVPEPLWLEEDPRHLDHPFFIMEEITGCEASPMKLMGPPWDTRLGDIGRQKWTILGEIARADPNALGLTTVMPAVTPETAWRHELDHWLRDLDDDELEPQPITRAATRWLLANPPAGAAHQRRACRLPHGNFLSIRTGDPGISTGDPTRRSARGPGLEPQPGLALGGRCARRRTGAARGGDPHLGAGQRLARRSGGAALVGGLLEREGSGHLALRRARSTTTAPITIRSSRSRPWMQCNSQDRATLELLGHLP
jgi:hypothetical protein